MAAGKLRKPAKFARGSVGVWSSVLLGVCVLLTTCVNHTRHDFLGPSTSSPLLSIQLSPGGIVSNYFSPFDYIHDMQFCDRICVGCEHCEDDIDADAVQHGDSSMIEKLNILTLNKCNWKKYSNTTPMLLIEPDYTSTGSNETLTLALVDTPSKLASVGHKLRTLSSSYLMVNLHVNLMEESLTISPYKLSMMIQLCAMLSTSMAGDIHPNPGPRCKYPCGICKKAVKYGQDGICCDHCDTWMHREVRKCIRSWQIIPTYPGHVLLVDFQILVPHYFGPLVQTTSLMKMNFQS